jgi:hypothetical protein
MRNGLGKQLPPEAVPHALGSGADARDRGGAVFVVTEDAQRAAVAAEAVPPSVRGERISISAYNSPHSCAGSALPHADRAYRPPTGGGARR